MLINIPKIMHFYWDGSKMSYLQYLTIITFNKYNPTWKIIIHEPTIKCDIITWASHEQKIEYAGKDYYPELKQLIFLRFNTIDFKKIGFKEMAPEVHKSDYLRWYILTTFGGGWSDFDILYIKSLSRLNAYEDADTVICYGNNKHIIGFYLSRPDNPFFKKILNESIIEYTDTQYQSIGSTLMNKIYPDIEAIISFEYPIKLLNLNVNTLYPVHSSDLQTLFKNTSIDFIKEYTLGIHWYNGSNESKNFNNSYAPESNNMCNSITKILEKLNIINLH